MSNELVWAVTDGPAGTTAVALPEDRLGARRLGLHYGGAFWCSTQAGGCGGRLVLHAGDEVRPYFRHQGNARCRIVGARSDAERAYEHLRYQRALTTWLTGQGYRPRLEAVPGSDGGSGIHVVVDEVSSALEVQLSALSDTSWRERDDQHRRRVRQVTWLYGSAAEPAAATEAAVRGVSLVLRRHNTGLAVGVRDIDDRTRWVRLAACRLTADGFWAPGMDEARALHAGRTAERQAAARRVAQQAARRATSRSPVGEGARAVRASRPASATIPWVSQVRPLPFPS